MDSTTALMLVNIAVWLGIGGYVAFLSRNQQEIAKKLNNLSDESKQNDE